MTQKIDRQPKIDKFNFEANKEVYTFDVKGDLLHLELKPALGSGYPDLIRVTMPLPRGMDKPTAKPIMWAHRAIFEVGGKQFFGIVAHFDWPVLEGADNIPCIGWGLDVTTLQSVCRLDSIGQREPSEILGALGAKILLTKSGKPLGAGSLKTKVGDIDPIAMTQTWTATIDASGVPAYSTTGHVKDLRLAGIKDLLTFKFFTEGTTFSDASSGLNHAVVKDWTGLFHVVSYTGNTIIQATKAKTSDAAFLVVDSLTKQSQNPWKI
jgi:hypothetical protein